MVVLMRYAHAHDASVAQDSAEWQAWWLPSSLPIMARCWSSPPPQLGHERLSLVARGAEASTRLGFGAASRRRRRAEGGALPPRRQRHDRYHIQRPLPSPSHDPRVVCRAIRAVGSTLGQHLAAQHLCPAGLRAIRPAQRQAMTCQR
jgi:hypothetical protein